MLDRQEHLQEVGCYLQKHFSAQDWIFSFLRGHGMETYFVKVGAPVDKYPAMAESGLTEPAASGV